jgi:hypothetical protein
MKSKILLEIHHFWPLINLAVETLRHSFLWEKPTNVFGGRDDMKNTTRKKQWVFLPRNVFGEMLNGRWVFLQRDIGCRNSWWPLGISMHGYWA